MLLCIVSSDFYNRGMIQWSVRGWCGWYGESGWGSDLISSFDLWGILDLLLFNVDRVDWQNGYSHIPRKTKQVKDDCRLPKSKQHLAPSHFHVSVLRVLIVQPISITHSSIHVTNLWISLSPRSTHPSFNPFLNFTLSLSRGNLDNEPI